MAAPPSEACTMAELPREARPSPGARGLWIALMVVGVLLRLYPVLWGSTFFDEGQFSLHSDEPKLVRFVDDFPWSLVNHHDYRYPTFMHNVWGTAWWIFGDLFGLRDGVPSEVGIPSYERALIFGRVMNVLVFGFGSLLLTFAFARKLFGQGAALWALAAMNLFAWTMASTALVQVDVCSAVGLLALFYLLIDVEGGVGLGRRQAVYLGLALGTAISMKYTAGIGVIGVGLVAWKQWRLGQASARQVGSFLAVGFGATMLAFVVFMPGAIYDASNFIGSLRYEFDDKSSGGGAQVSFERFRESFQDVLPWWLVLPAVLGAAWAMWRKRSMVLISVLLCSALYLLVTRRSFKPDYGILLVPYVATLAGVAAAQLARMRPRLLLRPLLITAVLAGHLYVGMVMHGRYVDDTRYRFQSWAIENIPSESMGEGPRASHRPLWSCPKVPTNFEFVSVHTRPEWIVLNQRDANTALMAIEAGEERFYGLRPLDLEFYRDVLQDRRKKYHYDLIVSFEPAGWPIDKQGKIIEVYRKSPNR